MFHAIFQAETRQGRQGVLDATRRMPRETMLYAYTRNAALAMGQVVSLRQACGTGSSGVVQAEGR